MKHYTNIFILILISIIISACGINTSVQNVTRTGQNPLLIPALIDSRYTPEIELVMQNGAHEFYSGAQSETMGFNGDYLGPTIRLYRDTDVTITFSNNIEEPTTVHGHGLHVNGEIDGGPQSVIQPGESWQITIPVRQEAGTSWYHPHRMGKTAHHVHAGLAGLYLIEDENSQALDLPKDYGVNDIPLVIQDRSFTDGKMNEYSVTVEEIRDGLREDTIVVNGTVDAYHTVPQGWVRLRLLNGSNARFYRFHFDNDVTFFKIATEGGFLNQPVEMEHIDMAPGERNEIMIDLSDGQNTTLMADLLPADPEDISFWDRDNPQELVVELRVDPTLQSSGTLPDTLNDIAYFVREDATQIRTISLDMEVRGGSQENMDMLGINGQAMDMGFINEQINKGEVEIWRITGQRMPHPFHIHGVSFQILTLNGEPPAEADRGWKDTVVVWDEVTEIIVRFDHIATEEFPYMYHCHMLEHEEYGMMGQFTVD
jgi:bilirubin oxidase